MAVIRMAILLWPFVGVLALASEDWIRLSSALNSPDIPKSPLILETIGVEDGRSVGTGTYYNHRSADLIVAIEGTRTSDNRFWPDIEVEVAAELRGKWESTMPKVIEGKRSTWTVHYNDLPITFYFALDPLLSHVGSMRFARLRLKTGESATFFLDDLVKTAKPRATNSPDEMAVYDGVYEPESKSPFILRRVTSTAEHSNGIFSCGTLDGRAIFLEGAKNDSGHFSVSAQCDVANDLSADWRLIGTARARGKPMILEIPSNDINSDINIDLDAFRSMIGRFRYGRVTLKEGISARFELNQLLPRSGLAIPR